MKNTKKNLLAEIEKKAQKIRDKRNEASNNKTLEAAVFDFFKNIEDSRKMTNGRYYDQTLFHFARQTLEMRIKNGFDFKAKISIEFNQNEDLTSWEETDVRGVTIWWSKEYITKNNCDPTRYIDTSEMLFI